MNRIGDGRWQCEACGGVLVDPGDRTNRPCTLCLIKAAGPAAAVEIKPGAGTELKKLLGWLGIEATSSCFCNARAAAMDARGTAWCEQNIDTIVRWLKEAAEKQNLAFSEFLARRLVRLAIWQAKRKEQAHG